MKKTEEDPASIRIQDSQKYVDDYSNLCRNLSQGKSIAVLPKLPSEPDSGFYTGSPSHYPNGLTQLSFQRLCPPFQNQKINDFFDELQKELISKENYCRSANDPFTSSNIPRLGNFSPSHNDYEQQVLKSTWKYFTVSSAQLPIFALL